MFMKNGKIAAGLLLFFFILSVLPFTAAAAATKGKNYDNCAYYDVTWAECTVSEDSVWYISYSTDAWEDIYNLDALNQLFGYDDTGYNAAKIYENLGWNKHCLIWYGWVGQDGYWKGHLNGTPTVKNTVTGESVAVTKWEASMTSYNEYYNFKADLGTWSVSGEGSVIDVDTIADGLAQQVSTPQVGSSNRVFEEALSVRLYLADGNSIKLSYSDIYEYRAAELTDDVTAKGNWESYRYYFSKTGSDYYRGTIYFACVVLGSPNNVKDYHFYIDKTVSGAEDGAQYTVPVQISVDGGAPITVNIETTGNDTFTKEVTFKAYEGDYTIEVAEKASSLPKNMQIVSGTATTAASLADVDKSADNTATLENEIVPEKEVPKTGDSNPLILWTLLLVSSLGVMAFMLKRRA